jgi:hypothetical protein
MSPPRQLRTGHVAPSGWCHVASPGGATWHFSTGPNGALKILLAGDTWQPLVLPCGMLMSTVIMLMSSFHVSHADVSSTDDDVAPVDLPCLTTTLTVNIFQSVTLFDESFAPLEILRHALHDHAIFTEFWEL